MILAPRGLGRILVKILRRNVVVLAGDGAAQTREVGLGLIGAGIAVRIHLGVVDPARLKDGVQDIPMRGFVGMNDGAARNAVPNDLGTIGLALHDEGQDTARALRQCDDDAAVTVLMFGQAAVYTVLFAVLRANVATEVGTIYLMRR